MKKEITRTGSTDTEEILEVIFNLEQLKVETYSDYGKTLQKLFHKNFKTPCRIRKNGVDIISLKLLLTKNAINQRS